MPPIFVQIASYRDPELPATVADAIAKAAQPEQLRFGIVWQGVPGIDPLPLMAHQSQCCIRPVSPHQSQGVGWARAQTQQLWQGEPYTLQIDSHMRFVQGWDELLFHLLHNCTSDKPILTAYPPPYFPPDTLTEGPPTRLGAAEFVEPGILSLRGCHSLAEAIQPQLGLFIAGGFWFAAADIIADVPYDPHLYFLGEETNLTVRAWTQGWDIFYPNQVVCYHEYSRQDKPKHWQEKPNWWELDHRSRQRLRQLVKVTTPTDLGCYGLGTARSLAAYEAFSGVNFRSGELSTAACNGIPQSEWGVRSTVP